MPELQGNAAAAGSRDVLSQNVRYLCLWVIAVFVSATLDIPVSNWLGASGIDQIVDHAWWAKGSNSAERFG